MEGAGSGDEGLWTCAIEYYKFGGGKGSSRILEKDTYVHVVSPTTTTKTTTSTTIQPTFSTRGTKIIWKDLHDNALPTTKNLETEVSLAKFVPHAISILVIVIFVVLFTLIVVLHKLKNVRQQQQQQGQQRLTTARSQVEAELSKLPDIHDVMFLKRVFPHVMRLPSDDLGLNL